MAHGIYLKATHTQYGYLGFSLHAVPERRTHSRQQLAHIEGLIDIVVSTEIERFYLFDFPVTRRKHNDWQIGPFAHALDHVLTVAIRQTEIEQDDVRRLGGNEFNTFGNRSGTCHFIIIGFKGWPEKPQDRRFVVYDENPDFSAHLGVLSRGTVMMTRAPRPLPTGLSASIVPPCASIMPFAMARPRPVPWLPSAP